MSGGESSSGEEGSLLSGSESGSEEDEKREASRTPFELSCDLL